MKKIALIGVSLFMLLTASQVQAQKKETKKPALEVKKDSKTTKSASTTTVTDAREKTSGTKTKTQTSSGTAATASKDKVVGKDAQGHDIYEGPRGGKYYLKNGKKIYVKK